MHMAADFLRYHPPHDTAFTFSSLLTILSSRSASSSSCSPMFFLSLLMPSPLLCRSACGYVRAQKHACLHTYTFSYLFDFLSLDRALARSLSLARARARALSYTHTHTHTHTHKFQGKRIAADCVKRRLLQRVEDHNAPCFSSCISSGLGWHGSECYIRYMYVSVNKCVYVCVHAAICLQTRRRYA